MSNYFKHKMRTKRPVEIVGWVLLAIIGFTGLVILFGFIVMWLWNWLMPDLFGLGTITYWQAMGICLLSKILFGGFGGGGGSKSSHKSRKHERHQGENQCKDGHKNDFSKWQFYDKFWEDEGKDAFHNYVANQNAEEE
jgi:hypothetical protein